MKMSQKVLTISVLTILLLPFLASADSPGIPHKFYGTVSFTNGTTPNGLLVEAKINSVVVGSSVTGDGKYGYNPDLLFATDPQNTNAGKTVEFYVSGIKATQTPTFINGESTNLNLTVSGNIGTIEETDEDKPIENKTMAVASNQLANVKLGENLNITISSDVSTNAIIEKIEKKSSGNVAIFSGKNFLNAYDIKISGGNLNISVTMKYDGTGIDEDTIIPYWFNTTSSSWVIITPFTIDKTANTITFTISSGQTVYGVFGSVAQAASTPPSGGGGGGGTTVTYKTGDIDKNSKVDIFDFNTLMVNWGNSPTNSAADLDNNGKVDIFDFNLLMVNWG